MKKINIMFNTLIALSVLAILSGLIREPFNLIKGDPFTNNYIQQQVKLSNEFYGQNVIASNEGNLLFKNNEQSLLLHNVPIDSAELIKIKGQLKVSKLVNDKIGSGINVGIFTKVTSSSTQDDIDFQNFLGFKVESLGPMFDTLDDNQNPKIKYRVTINQNSFDNAVKTQILEIRKSEFNSFEFNWDGFEKKLQIIFDGNIIEYYSPKYAQNTSVYFGIINDRANYEDDNQAQLNSSNFEYKSYSSLQEYIFTNRTVRTTLLIALILSILVYTILKLTHFVLTKEKSNEI